MDIQKINVKLFVDTPETPPLDAFLGIFARWREQRSDEWEWIDMADYGHVTGGPGIMLIGQTGNLSVDLADPGPGLLYANKTGLTGSLEDRIEKVFHRSISLSTRLTRDPDYPREMVPRPGSWEFTLNDRLAAPNSEETDRTAQPAIQSLAERVFGDRFTLVRQSDPGRRYAVVVHSDRTVSLEALATAAGLATSG